MFDVSSKRSDIILSWPGDIGKSLCFILIGRLSMWVSRLVLEFLPRGPLRIKLGQYKARWSVMKSVPATFTRRHWTKLLHGRKASKPVLLEYLFLSRDSLLPCDEASISSVASSECTLQDFKSVSFVKRSLFYVDTAVWPRFAIVCKKVDRLTTRNPSGAVSLGGWIRICYNH